MEMRAIKAKSAPRPKGFDFDVPNPTPPASQGNEWVMLIGSIAMILLGAALFFVPSFGGQEIVDMKKAVWSSPLTAIFAIVMFCALFWYTVWCTGLVPNRPHPLQAKTPLRRAVVAHTGLAALAVWITGAVAWGVGLTISSISIPHMTALFIGILVTMLYVYTFWQLRMAMDRKLRERNAAQAER